MRVCEKLFNTNIQSRPKRLAMETADPESASPSSATAEEASAPSEEAGKIWAPEPRPPLVPETDGTLPTLKSSRKHYKRKQWPPFVEMYVLIDIETSGGVKGENRIISLASRAYVGSPRPRPGDWFDSGLVELRSVIGGGDAGGTDSAKDSATDSATDSGTDSDKDSATASEWRQRIESLGLDLTDSAADFDELVQIPSYQSINPRAAEVHRITEEKLRREAKGDFSVVGRLWLEWLQPLVDAAGSGTVMLVAHNGFACDYRLLATELARNGLELPGQSEGRGGGEG